MASIQRRGRGSRAITTATHEPARRPATPSRNAHWDQEPLLDKDALVAFAAEATAALRRESSALAKLRRPSPFFAILCSLLSDVEERLENAASVTESKVSELLATLERLAKWPKPFKAPTRPFDRNAYSRLIHILGDSSQLARSCIKTLAEDPRAVNDRQKFQKAFKAFANVKLGPRGPKLSELTRSSAESESNSNSATAQCLQKLYWTLCQLCRCSLAVGGGGFKANVVVDYEARPAVADDGVIIESFFLHRHHTGNNETGEWKETRIQVLLDQYDIEDSDNTKTRVLRSARGDKKISDFCKLLQSQELGCLKLRASSGGLFDDGIELSRDGISLQAPSVSLARVLASASLNKDSQRKLLLSYLLAKAVWQFYDSDWIAEAWSKQEVQFMQQRIDKLQNKVLLNYRPFISAEFRDDAPPQGAPSLEGYGVVAKTPKGTHIFPKILALGITLLEIELGEGIENRYAREFLDADGRPRANAAHMTAGDFITSDKWKAQKKVYLPVRQAIEICVKPDTGQLGTDPARVRENLHRCVVAPLGALFGMAYDCDGCPEKFDPGPMNFESSDEPCDDIYSVPGSAHMRETSGSPNSPSAQQLVSLRNQSRARETANFSAMRIKSRRIPGNTNKPRNGFIRSKGCERNTKLALAP
ncbi:hypothetical protein B0T10DRAFT_281115 [Thelonectria olida]|uniref:DUF7580 domain-containing protein n=1 Tax=Thelonectria olida TaxID=1576542 RepID=A0A9P8VNX3_9HYPO|nr:hypothetical protein B0T10DRAFT_281115 [Thelonectria olida]